MGKSRYVMGGPFLYMEPGLGLADHHEQRVFEVMKGIQTISPGGELRTSFGIDSAACFVRLATRASQVLKGGPAQDMYIKNRTTGSNHSAAL